MRLKAFKINTGQVLIHLKQSAVQPFGPERNFTALGQALGNSSLFHSWVTFGGMMCLVAARQAAEAAVPLKTLHTLILFI